MADRVCAVIVAQKNTELAQNKAVREDNSANLEQ